MRVVLLVISLDFLHQFLRRKKQPFMVVSRMNTEDRLSSLMLLFQVCQEVPLPMVRAVTSLKCRPQNRFILHFLLSDMKNRLRK